MHISLPQDVLDYINYLCICNREHQWSMPTSFLRIFEKFCRFFFLTICICHAGKFKRDGQSSLLESARPLCFIVLQTNCKYFYLYMRWVKNSDFAASCTFITFQSWSVSKAGRFIAAVSPCGLLPKQMWPTEFWLQFWCKQILTKQNTNKWFK